jgi:hypothetical protein
VLNSEKIKNEATNFCSLEHSWLISLAQYLRREEYDAIFDGIGGDVLSAGLFLSKPRLQLYRNGHLDEFANELLGNEGYLPEILTKSAYKRFNRQLALNMLTEELQIYRKEENPVGQFFFWNRTRRNVAMSPWGILSKSCNVFTPYLDRELYKFLTSLPAEYFLDHTFHEKTIAHCYPRYAQLAYESKRISPQRGSYFVNLYEHSEYLTYFLNSFWKSYLCSPFFLYTRLMRDILFPKYFEHSTYKIPIYLTQLATRVFIR